MTSSAPLTIASNSLRGTPARARIATVCSVADASCASTIGSARGGYLALFPGRAEAGRERPVELDETFQHHGADTGIGDRFGCRRHHREAAARAFAFQIDVERDRKDALQPFADRHLLAENLDHRRARVLAVALIALDVELALVAERAIEARTVHAGGGAEIVQRGRGETAFPEQVERLAERDIGLIGARPPAPLWLRRGSVGSRWRRSFFVPFRNKFLDRIYIMRDSIKINPARRSGQNRQGGTHGSLFLAARLLDGDPDRAV